MNNKYKIKITGKNTKRFLNNLIKYKVYLYSIEQTDKSVTIIVDEDGLEKINNTKTSYDIKIIRKYGLVNILDTINKYKIFLISLVISIIIIKLLSNIIFSIEVKYPKEDIREMVLSDLDLYGIRKYHFKVSYKEKEKIIKKILNKEKDHLEWLEIENIGTKYIVKVEERIKNNITKEKACQNIIAKKNAMILEIDAKSGEVVTYKNQYVKKGDILISGIIHKDDEAMKKVRAEGTVYGEVWYKVEIDVPNYYIEERETGRSKEKLEIKFLNKSFFLFDKDKYKSFKVNRNPLLENKLLPISFNYSKVYETNKIERDYRNNSSNKSLEELATKKLKAKLNTKDEIISKKVLKKSENNSRILVEVFFKVKENITDIENIDNVDLEKLKEGDDNESSD